MLELARATAREGLRIEQIRLSSRV